MKKIFYTLVLSVAYVCAVQAQTFNDTYTVSDLAANKGRNKFTFFNFTSGEEVAAADSNSTKWDIAFSASTVIFNSGVKGPGAVTAQIITPAAFETLADAPSAGYSLNVLSGSGSWYTYNPGINNSGPHTIIPIQDKIIVVKLADGSYAKLQILNYYKGAPSDVPSTGPSYTGTSQYYTFRYVLSDPIETFNNTSTVTDLAANKGRNKFTFFNFASGKEVAVADSNSTKWDIAFSASTVIFNSGTKGPGVVSAQIVTPSTFQALAAAPAAGYSLNSISGSGSWYTYNPGVNNSGPHTIIPMEDKIIVAKLADGRFVKIQILNYYKGAPSDVPTTGPTYTGTSQHYTFRYLLSDGSEKVTDAVYTASDIAANKGKSKFTFFNFTSGKEVAVADSNSTRWDIAFSATTVIFNSGSKGPGTVAAQIVTPTTFEALTEAPAAGYDVNIISGSGSWYTYNSGANNSGPHTITPIANKIIVAKLADGRFVKIQIQNYYQGAPADVPTTGADYTGVSQYYTFRYLIFDAPKEFNTAYTISDLAANKGRNKFTFFNFASGKEVALADSNSTKWDIAFCTTTVIFNSGSKGPGVVAAQIVTPTTFDALTEAPAKGYDLNLISGSGSWYTYNSSANNGGPHTITPIANKIIVAKLADGSSVKIEILNYYQGAPANVPTTGADYIGVAQYYTFRYAMFEATEEPVTPTSVFTSNTKTIRIYPNPVSSSTNKLSIVSEMTSGTVKIVDVLGNEVYTSAISQNESELTNMNLAKGFYVVLVESNGTVYQQKLIVE